MHSSTALAGPVQAPAAPGPHPVPPGRRPARPVAAVSADDAARAPLVGYLVLAPAGTDPADLLDAVRAEFPDPPAPLTVLSVPADRPVPHDAAPATGPGAVSPPSAEAGPGERRSAPPAADVRESAGIRVDRTARTVEVDGTPLDLTYLEYELLALLVAHPHRVFTRDQLVETVWGYGPVGDRRTVDVHVARVRRKLGDHRPRVVTVHRVGYKYVPPARG
ncbi:winged helix-turn-helix domain-containing protein [Streptomyces bohaiensis]|uniref:winged helix-turn-helix domain-containing protein n=1 Tax=Streptomyces bohaiensis TaxID=1431344 RepID=UPI003B7FBCC1